ncbi:translation initiation factor IF-2-like [Macadamia integrifolia]|uniref:translation initiation factor IF-2-like n=1 Tax=Macadamia integrifolia TaxID=60698 RepID=UPI001C52BE92|nr:translation initiation factor IF-2-like [Macadamia integrifolia]
MEKPRFKPENPSSSSTVQVLSPSSSGRRSSASNSPEFEFWMVRNPSFPQPQLLSADELIVDGVLLPLQLLPHHSEPPDPEEHKADSETPNPETEPEPGPGPESSAALTESSTVLSTSKRWRDIFRLGEKKTTTTTSSTAAEDREKDKEKEKKKERKGGAGGGVIGTELNINIWPFSRSHSAGNSGNRPKIASATATRKVSSAPCSRSNSAGESKSRKWPSSPGRGGVHLGRSSPVWQVRRGGSGLKNSDRTGTPMMVRNADKGVKKEAVETRRNKNNCGGVGVGGGGGGGGGARTRVLNLNVPMCIGYRPHLSCRSYANNTAATAGGNNSSSSNGQSTGGGGGGSGRSGGSAGNSVGNLLNLRTIFSKKVY